MYVQFGNILVMGLIGVVPICIVFILLSLFPQWIVVFAVAVITIG